MQNANLKEALPIIPLVGARLSPYNPRMTDAIAFLQPEAVWREFAAISAIPRCSKHEERIRAYVLARAEALGREARVDEVGNVVVYRPGTGAGAGRAPVVLQGHLDMVCEKNMDTVHDFSRDAIRLVRDGEWLTADGTTLGADNGIAVAMMLALVALGDDEALPPLECLFTIDEETGLTGALNLDPALITGRRMINLDSEEEGFFCIGCAGGRNTTGRIPLVWEAVGAEADCGLRVRVTGLRGGHSGADIHLEHANGVVLGARLVECIAREVPSVRLAAITGGDKHNAIPRECEVRMALPSGDAERVRGVVAACEETFRDEYGSREPRLAVGVTEDAVPERVISLEGARRVVDLLLAVPHGVLGMSHEVEGLVETSTNLASVALHEGTLTVLTSQRSSRRSLIDYAGERLAALFRLAGGTVDAGDGYPAWTPAPQSPLVETAVAVYRRVTGADPEVGAFHAGLECGVIGSKVDGMDMLSFGPDMEGVHTPDERLHIASAERTWTFLLELLRAL